MEEFYSLDAEPLKPAPTPTIDDINDYYLWFAEDILLNISYDGTPFCCSGHHHTLDSASASCVFCQAKKEQMTRLRWKYFWFVSRLPKSFSRDFEPTFELWWARRGNQLISDIERSMYPIRSDV